MPKKTAKSKTAKSQKPKPPKVVPKGGKVGKGKPPEHTRFHKGTSGNLKGRPKGSKNLSTIIMDAANAQVTATIDGKPRKISKLVATAMQLATKAAGGDQKSVGQFLDWVDEIEARAAAVRPVQFPFTHADLEVLRETYERMKLCERMGTGEKE
jgi:hypothetical protein